MYSFSLSFGLFSGVLDLNSSFEKKKKIIKLVFNPNKCPKYCVWVQVDKCRCPIGILSNAVVMDNDNFIVKPSNVVVHYRDFR